MATYKDRMLQMGQFILPQKGSPDREAFDATGVELRKDPIFKKQVSDLWQRAKQIVHVKQHNGAGLVTDQTIREFHLEYNNRAVNYGLDSQPVSFNVVEAFMEYIAPLSVFTIRPERDHIFSFSAFLDFVTSDAPMEAHKSAANLLSEGVVYSFSNWDSPHDLTFSTSTGKTFGIAGVSMIRHRSEISMILLAGELIDEESPLSQFEWKNTVPARGREEMQPDASLDHGPAPLLGYPGLWRTLALTRFDLDDRSQQVRHILQDMGDSYVMLTDDPSIYYGPDGSPIVSGGVPAPSEMVEVVNEYAVLFELCKTCLHLPYYFDEHEDEVVEEPHRTKYGELPRPERRSLKDKFPKDERLASRPVLVLRRNESYVTPSRTEYQAPQFHVEISGYWKQLPHGHVGTNKNGNTVHGKTWVEQRIEWRESASTSDLSVSAVSSKATVGSDGFIYVMRSAMHPPNVWKVGHTTRDTATRSKELSRGSGVPDRMFPMHEWEVENSAGVEAKIHDRLANYRLNISREFFQIELCELVRIINDVIASTGSNI